MENCTWSNNCTQPDLTLAGPLFGAYVVISTFVLTLIIALIVTTIAALCVAHSVAKLVRVFLINLLVAGLVTALIGMAFLLISLILNFSTSPPPGLWFCRILIYGYAVSTIARLYSLATFSLVVLVMVRYGKDAFKTVYIVVSLVAIWTVGILVAAHVLVPSFFAAQYYDGVACFAQTDHQDLLPGAKVAFSFLELFLGGFVPLVISIVVPIVVLCYVRRNTMTEGSSYNKGMARFALFLVVGSFLNFLAQIIVAIIIYFNEIISVAIYLAYGVGGIFLIPTPIFVFLFLKPVRNKICRFLCCRRRE